MKDLSPAFPRDNWSARTKPPKAIIIHHTVTATAATTLRVLKERGLSTHFEVDQKGNVYRYLDPAKATAYHAGGANTASIGIDITHRSGAPFPEAQVVAARVLVQELANTFNIALKVAPDNAKRKLNEWIAGGYTLLRHRNVNKTACPEHFPIDRMIGPAAVV